MRKLTFSFPRRGGGVLTYVDMRHVPRSRVGFPRARPYVRVCFGHLESVLPYLRLYQCSAPNVILEFHSQYGRYFVQFTFYTAMAGKYPQKNA